LEPVGPCMSSIVDPIEKWNLNCSHTSAIEELDLSSFQLRCGENFQLIAFAMEIALEIFQLPPPMAVGNIPPQMFAMEIV
jgi:hypothetical protein